MQADAESQTNHNHSVFFIYWNTTDNGGDRTRVNGKSGTLQTTGGKTQKAAKRLKKTIFPVHHNMLPTILIQNTCIYLHENFILAFYPLSDQNYRLITARDKRCCLKINCIVEPKLA